MKYLIIVNPISGRGFAGKAIPQIEALLKSHNLEYDLVQTERPWHAAELTEKAPGTRRCHRSGIMGSTPIDSLMDRDDHYGYPCDPGDRAYQ